MNNETIPKDWVQIEGIWVSEAEALYYREPTEAVSLSPHGIVLNNKHRLRRGIVQANVRFLEKVEGSAARILLGFNPKTHAYFSAGLGGHNRGYVVSEYIPNTGWFVISATGSERYLRPSIEYHLRVQIEGQRMSLAVDDITVIDVILPHPLLGDEIGLFAWGNNNIEYRSFKALKTKDKIFVVMQFGEPYDAVYKEVIKPVVEEFGLEGYRVDDVYRPGIILQDIIQGIVESEVVVAEITPNPNVFYELGYAHALGKPTILLADRSSKELPFDIRSYRCIFYDNTIQGKKVVERNLREHLLNILNTYEINSQTFETAEDTEKTLKTLR
jgi:hypothetical protein